MLGVELTGSEVRVLELQSRPGGEKPVVTAVGVARADALAALPPEARRAAWTEVLRNCIRTAGVKTRRVALAVPQSAVLTSLVPFDGGLSEEALELRVKLEAEHHLSTSLDAVALDFERLGPRGDGRDDVLLVACRKEVVAEQCAIAEAAGLEAMAVDVEGYAVGRALGEARAKCGGKKGSRPLSSWGPGPCSFLSIAGRGFSMRTVAPWASARKRLFPKPPSRPIERRARRKRNAPWRVSTALNQRW